MSEFDRSLEAGIKGEELVKAWLRCSGYTVVSDFSSSQPFTGPRIYSPEGTIVQPDLLVTKQDTIPTRTEQSMTLFWVEVKSKSVFSWHRKSETWTTGMDLRSYVHYLEVTAAMGWDMMIVFVHLDKEPSQDAKNYYTDPWPCPTGIFWQWLHYLGDLESHRWGDKMVYWPVSAFTEDVPIKTLFELKHQMDTKDRQQS